MPADAIGTLEIKLLSATAPNNEPLFAKEAFGKVSLDYIDWRKTPVCQGQGVTVQLDGSVSLPLSDQKEAYVEVWTFDKEKNKEEIVGRGKIHIHDVGVVEKGEVVADAELHHHLHKHLGNVKVQLNFVKLPEPPKSMLLKDAKDATRKHHKDKE
ncbi:hypothetical protein HK104_004520 [Borealophlyctis nickersoniae]|nr:hypothetical protein HK104_004520 [Borealophlyctis nickersoniae]